MKKNIENAQVNILLEVDGKIHLVGIDKEKFNAIDFLVKSSVTTIIPTKKTQEDLLGFLEFKK